MVFNEAGAVLTKINFAGQASKCRFDRASHLCFPAMAVTHLAHSLATIQFHKWMPLHCIIVDCVECMWKIGWGHHMSVSLCDGTITHGTNQPLLERLQPKQPSVCWQRPVAGQPQNISVHDGDVEETPEQVFPPSPPRTTDGEIRSHLIHPVNTAHGCVVPLDAVWHGQLDQQVLPSYFLHAILPVIVSGNEADVTLVMPLDKHNAVPIGPLRRLPLSQMLPLDTPCGLSEWCRTGKSCLGAKLQPDAPK